MWLSDLDVRVVDDSAYERRCYELLRPLRYQSARLGRVFEVPAGFRTDFASIPLPALSLIGTLGDRAATLHDWLVRTGEIPRQTADRVFLEALRDSGVEKSVAELMYMAVCAYTAGIQPPPERDERYIA